jgi:hypothetical protein
MLALLPSEVTKPLLIEKILPPDVLRYYSKVNTKALMNLKWNAAQEVTLVQPFSLMPQLEKRALCRELDELYKSGKLLDQWTGRVIAPGVLQCSGFFTSLKPRKTRRCSANECPGGTYLRYQGFGKWRTFEYKIPGTGRIFLILIV